MKCPKCQYDNREKAKFCIECGNKLERSCPECKKPLPPEAKFCDECGHHLQKSEQGPAFDFNHPQSYTPKFLADKILTSRSSLEGERKLVTVLFADVAEFTSLSEKLDPEEVHQIMDGCFKILMEEIHKYEGTINQFTGDGVMALFGAPVAHEDHAQRACYASLSILKSLETYSGKIKRDFDKNFKMRIGLNSGPVIVGSIGNDLRMDYTAIGDTVNLASRMESLAKAGTVAVSANTYKIVRNFFEFESLGNVTVKGKAESQGAFRLVKKGAVDSRLAASAVKGFTKFVGRKNSMAALTEAYDQVKSGYGQIVGIVGEAGVGKSRLILEFKNMLSGDKNTWLEGRCLHFGNAIVYLPIIGIVRSYFKITDEDLEYITKKKIKDAVLTLDEKLEGLIAPFQELLSLKPDDESFASLEPKYKREKIFEALRNLFIRESQDNPLILVIEDLHWLDKTSEEFIDYLSGWLANTRIFLILLYRPEYTHQWGSKSFYTKIGLQQLGTASSIELIQAILEGAEVVPELKNLILHRAAGNPLFMEEFTHTLLENGSIQKKNNTYFLAENAARIDVPDTIQGIIAARMDRLEDNLKRTMQVASVIGRDFAYRILHSITGMRDDLKSCLLNLQGLEFIYEKKLFPELEYIFKHALIQEVAYNSLLVARRKEFHEKIGKAIEEIYVNRLEEFYEMLAYHYSKSDNLEKAYNYLKLSAEKAVDNYSNSEAFRFYKEALNLLNRFHDCEENKSKKLELIYLMLKPSLMMGLPESFLTILREGETLAKMFNDEKRLAQFYGVMGQYYSFKGNQSKGMECAEKCVNLAQKIQDIELMVVNTLNCYYATLYTGDFEKFADIASQMAYSLEQTKKEADFFGRPANPYSFVNTACGLAMGYLGKFNIGEALCEKGFRHAIQIDDILTIAFMEMLYSMFFCCKGDGVFALQHAKACINKVEKMDIGPLGLGLAYGILGWSFLIIGDHEACQKYGNKAIKLLFDIKMQIYACYYKYFISESYFESRSYKRALESMKETLTLSRNIDSKYTEAKLLILNGRIEGKMNHSTLDQAASSISKGIEFLKSMKLKPELAQAYVYLGELCVDNGKKEKAYENLKIAGNLFMEMGMNSWQEKTNNILQKL